MLMEELAKYVSVKTRLCYRLIKYRVYFICHSLFSIETCHYKCTENSYWRVYKNVKKSMLKFRALGSYAMLK